MWCIKSSKLPAEKRAPAINQGGGYAVLIAGLEEVVKRTVNFPFGNET